MNSWLVLGYTNIAGLCMVKLLTSDGSSVYEDN